MPIPLAPVGLGHLDELDFQRTISELGRADVRAAAEVVVEFDPRDLCVVEPGPDVVGVVVHVGHPVPPVRGELIARRERRPHVLVVAVPAPDIAQLEIHHVAGGFCPLAIANASVNASRCSIARVHDWTHSLKSPVVQNSSRASSIAER